MREDKAKAGSGTAASDKYLSRDVHGLEFFTVIIFSNHMKTLNPAG